MLLMESAEDNGGTSLSAILMLHLSKDYRGRARGWRGAEGRSRHLFNDGRHCTKVSPVNITEATSTPRAFVPPGDICSKSSSPEARPLLLETLTFVTFLPRSSTRSAEDSDTAQEVRGSGAP